jgi:hypothetical protein
MRLGTATYDRYTGILRNAEGGEYRTRLGSVLVTIDAGAVDVSADTPGTLTMTCEDGSVLTVGWDAGTLDLPSDLMPQAYHLFGDFLERVQP